MKKKGYARIKQNDLGTIQQKTVLNWAPGQRGQHNPMNGQLKIF